MAFPCVRERERERESERGGERVRAKVRERESMCLRDRHRHTERLYTHIYFQHCVTEHNVYLPVVQFPIDRNTEGPLVSGCP